MSSSDARATSRREGDDTIVSLPYCAKHGMDNRRFELGSHWNEKAEEVTADRGSLPFEQNGPKEDIDDLGVVVCICPL